MDTRELINKINKYMDQVDLITVRTLIENNLKVISENRHLLSSNARSLLEIIKENRNSENNALNRKEMNVIYSINLYASNFDINGLKLSIKNNPTLIMRSDIKDYLNADARALLVSMKVINQDHEQTH